MNPDGEDYLQWLAAAPKGVRWDRAQEMWEEYNRKRREQAESIANRLLGKKKPIPDREGICSVCGKRIIGRGSLCLLCEFKGLANGK